MASGVADHAIPMPPARKRRDTPGKVERKSFVCTNGGCGRSFTRAEHLQRHVLNHSNGEYTCNRCSAHFKRRDLLERHMTRHRQKDEEAGAEGSGILNTRKRCWKDSEGKIVTKKPNLSGDIQGRQSVQSLPDFVPLPHQVESIPISPPISQDTSIIHSWDGHDSEIATNYPPTTSDLNALPTSESYSPIAQQFWLTDLPQPQFDPLASTTFDDAPFNEIFNPDTASSFNNPFTTMSNYNWLFDLDLARPELEPHPAMQNSLPAFTCDSTTMSQPNQSFDLHLEHMDVHTALSMAGHFRSSASQQTDSLQHPASSTSLVSPPLSDEEQNNDAARRPQTETANIQLLPETPASPSSESSSLVVERPMSMLQPSRSLPVLSSLARQRILDLVDSSQPAGPDGNILTHDHPLLALSCLQTYCDLFFTRFNTAYPLIHMSTFDPSKADTLLLMSVLLLGATYGEKDAHKLAVCIHDVLRPQIFANTGFTAKPSLWMLQTILLVECFGKSRAGQKQADFSHLFHGLLINLIRRSDCQSIHTPSSKDATDDVEKDWQIWCNAEQKKRLAFLCFMWDTQHAVLFCQSLCMSAFELRSSLPCDQSLWEAESAESWYRLSKTQYTTPLFLSCLKMYLHPETASIPRELNALSRSLLLHGLMSIAWDMQRRDQTSLGVIDSNPLGNWQSRLAFSYTAWHQHYLAFCSQYLSRLPSADYFIAKEFQVSRTATLALYHSAQILLYTPFLDLQIYAGARHILGRPVARHDYVRSQRVVKKWVAENLQEAGKAVWHAAALVSEGVDVLDGELELNDLGGGRLWHHPWSVYLGTLVIWGVWYARPVSVATVEQLPAHLPQLNDDEDEIIWDPDAEMKSLLDGILKSEPEKLLEIGNRGGISGRLGKRGTSGLAVVVSRCLSKIRWAVVHDGMMVLRGLVQWRLVGGGSVGGL